MAEFKTIDEAAFTAKAAPPRSLRATGARYDRRTGRVSVRLNSGIDISFEPRDVADLAQATAETLGLVKIDGAGGTLHFPRLDVDLSIPRLLESFLGPQPWTRREARAVASRENGKRGGRPRKSAVKAPLPAAE